MTGSTWVWARRRPLRARGGMEAGLIAAVVSSAGGGTVAGGDGSSAARPEACSGCSGWGTVADGSWDAAGCSVAWVLPPMSSLPQCAHVASTSKVSMSSAPDGRRHVNRMLCSLCGWLLSTRCHYLAIICNGTGDDDVAGSVCG